MKIRKKQSTTEDKVELQMTPMIDIVFQLLVFFIMSFKIAAQEGDFNIKMPSATRSDALPPENELPPMTLYMTANANGTLKNMTLNERSFGADFAGLHAFVIGYVGTDRGPNSIQKQQEVELNCDSNLNYEETIKAITALSGYTDGEGNVVKLIEKIKFSPPKAGS